MISIIEFILFSKILPQRVKIPNTTMMPIKSFRSNTLIWRLAGGAIRILNYNYALDMVQTL